ncbi:MAG: Gfo/Idh/MocA family oxidoreductase [Clostridiales bacterium]|nr:Gfo/Idh/MocA family oxidoreductase [Clostridiales bacterium]
MDALKVLVVGSGRRSLFYWRIAYAYPKYFQFLGMVCRTEEKAEKMQREYGIPALCSENRAAEMKPDVVVVAVNKASICTVAKSWLERGFAVLCETPAALNLEELEDLWRLRCENGIRLQVAEQYFRYPSYEACIAIAESGKIGMPYALELSAVHDYHAFSLIRKLLGTGFENATFFGKNYFFSVEETNSRYGEIKDGSVKKHRRTRVNIEFESGKVAFYDFDSIQYHSYIRSRHLRLQGEKGELDDGVLRWVDEKHQVHKAEIWEKRTDNGISEIRLENTKLYENPFTNPVLPQDETAIATLLFGMRKYIETGEEVYPLAEALQDAYFSILLKRAATGEIVQSETQLWG